MIPWDHSIVPSKMRRFTASTIVPEMLSTPSV